MRPSKSLVWLFLVTLPLVTSVPLWSASTFSPLTKDRIESIKFTGDCGQKQWSQNLDNAVTLFFSAVEGGECAATVRFKPAIELGHKPGITYDVESALPKQSYAIEVLVSESPETWVRTKPYPAVNRMVNDGLDFRAWKRTRDVTKLSGIRFVTLSTRPRISPDLTIRNLRLVERDIVTAPPSPEVSMDPAAALAAPAAEMPEPEPAVAQEPMVVQMEEPPLPDDEGGAIAKTLSDIERTSWRKGLITAGKALAFFTLLGAGGWLLYLFVAWIRQRPTRARAARPSISPLFEMNTRTWNTTRDEEGVLQVGGFSRISSEDLSDLKRDGFNALWLMGIWEIGPKVRHISRRYGQDFVGSPYAIADYRVSSELGSPEEFDALVKRSRDAGLPVIVDFVPNHMGLDCSWLNMHPEFFIHKVISEGEMGLSDTELEQRYPAHFAYHAPSYPENGRRIPKTIMVAFGKDPYFYPWIDTAQLDYALPAVRKKMIDVLCEMAKKVDGVRCDMAMLVLREQIKNHRHPQMPQDRFNAMMPQEFWTEAIPLVKKVNPNFIFIAETYWAMEGYLQELGFDYTYNKPLYEAICGAFHSGHAEGLMNFLRLLGTDFLSRSINFLENHDEERAMNALGDERQRAAAAMMCTLPGAVLIHQGQREGKRERLPVQRVLHVQREEENVELKDFYTRLLKMTGRPVFKDGKMHVLYSNNTSFVTYARETDEELALIVINTSDIEQKGSVYLAPGLKLETGNDVHLLDLFYDLKKAEVQQQPMIQPVYLYRAARIINEGLYIELQGHDAHIFLLEKTRSHTPTVRVIRRSLRANTKPMPVLAEV